MPRNKESMKWLCVCCGVLFLALSTFIRVIEVFPSGNDGAFMVLLAIASAFLTLGLAIASFPRWQSFFWISGVHIRDILVLFYSFICRGLGPEWVLRLLWCA